MGISIHPFVVFAVACGLLVAPRAGAKEWAIVGIHDPHGPGLPVDLEVAKEILAEALGEGARVLQAGEVVERLGLTPTSWAEIDALVAEAELFFFQLESEQARAKIERALHLLGDQVGREAWERVRTGRLLLAILHLQRGDEEEARRALLPVAGVQPHLELDPATTPPDLLEAWGAAKAHVASRAEGWLEIRCDPSCPGATVWVEANPMGPVESTIPLSPGAYRVIVRRTEAGEELRSLPRVVRIHGGEPTRLLLDLQAEQRVRLSDGALVSVPGGALGGERIAGIVAREAGVQATLAVGVRDDGSVRGWRLDERGTVLQAVDAPWPRGQGPAAEGDAFRALVNQLLARTERVSPRVVTPDASPGGVVAQRPRAAVPASSSWASSAKWATLGVAVLATGLGTWVTADAAADRAELRRLDAISGAYRGLSEARRAPELANSIRQKEAWSVALWTGAAVGAVTTVLLFLRDAEHGDARPEVE